MNGTDTLIVGVYSLHAIKGWSSDIANTPLASSNRKMKIISKVIAAILILLENIKTVNILRGEAWHKYAAGLVRRIEQPGSDGCTIKKCESAGLTGSDDKQ